MLRTLILLLTATGISGGSALYVAVRLLGPLPLPGLWRGILWGLVVVPTAGWPWLLVARHYFPGAWVGGAMSAVYVVLGLFSFLFTFTLLRDAAWLALLATVKVAGAVAGDGAPGWGAWLPRGLAPSGIAVVVCALGAFGVGAFQAAHPRLVEVTIPVANLAPDLDGLRIAQISDLHLDPLTSDHFLETVVARVNALHPDLVAITGDLVDATVAERGEEIRPLAGLAAPAFFATGNHEHYWGATAWCEALAACGVTVLRGDHRLVRRGGATVLVAGVEDPAAGAAAQAITEPATALAGAPDADFRLLLAHRPNAGFAAAEAGVDLQLSGHTHGGQFFPWNLLVNRIMPFSPGLHRHHDTWIYTSRGTGFWGPPVRLGAPAEITLLTLRAAQ